MPGTFDIDHFQPVAKHGDLALSYNNLVYSCASCNNAKGVRQLPNPELVLRAGDVKVHEDGRIEGQSRAARRLIRVLGLDDPAYNEFRGQWLCIIGLAKEYDPALYNKLMG